MPKDRLTGAIKDLKLIKSPYLALYRQTKGLYFVLSTININH
jgi:hypothetical protein